MIGQVDFHNPWALEQSLAADGARACFSSNLFPLSLNADRAPQLKASVRHQEAWVTTNMNIPFFSLLVSIGNSLFSLFRDRKREHWERSDRMALLCDGIAACLEQIASSLRDRKLPRSACIELAFYLRAIQDTVGEELDEDQAAQLEEHLRGANAGPIRSVKYLDELKFSLSPDASSVAKLEDDLKQIEEAVGSFRATALLLRSKV